MAVIEYIFVAGLFGLPVWLALRAWRCYFVLDRSSVSGTLQMKIGLTLVSMTVCLWVAVLGLMIVSDYVHRTSVLLDAISVPGIGLINLLICIGGIACSRLGRKSAQERLPFQKAIGLASSCMLLVWLLLLSNPH